MSEKKPKNIFIEGPVTARFIGDSIQKHSDKKDSGAHSIFLGQVRADVAGERRVQAIEYTAYEQMAIEKMHDIRRHIFEKYPLICVHVYHSLGIVEAGQISLFVFTSSAHRRAAIDACEELVEQIKSELPVWGKELFDDSSHRWKINK